VSDPLQKALDIADRLIANGREKEGLELLDRHILPVLDARVRAAREKTPRPPEQPSGRPDRDGARRV
jgi:hypothetical protein